jgi:hypothetical protein
MPSAPCSVGGLGGYIIAIAAARPGAVRFRPPRQPRHPLAATPLVDEGELKAFRDILARDPKNLQAAVSAGNLPVRRPPLRRSHPFYQQAFALNGSDVNVSTDLGTALWYAGTARGRARAVRAVAAHLADARADALQRRHRARRRHARLSGRGRGMGEAAGVLARLPNAAAVRELLADARLKSAVVRQ